MNSFGTLIIVVIVAVWSCTMSAQDACRGDMFGPLDIYSDMGAFAGAAGDVDGDGRLDVVVGNFTAATLSVYIGVDESHSFKRVVTYSLGNDPTKAALADVDGDGDLDALVGYLAGTTVSLLRNNGDGTFAPHEMIPTGSGPVWIETGDLNDDGFPDLVSANVSGGGVSVVLNDAGTGFLAPVPYPTGSEVWSVVIGNLDGVLGPDLAVASLGSDRISVLLNEGGGTFAAPVHYSGFSDPISIAADDIDDDSDRDLVVVNNGTDSLALMLNDGTGAFAPGDTHPVENFPRHVAIGDVNGDDLVDLISVNQLSDSISILRGEGGGAFAPQVTYDAGRHAFTSITLDIDADGALDLMIPNEVGYVRLLFNNGDGTFSTTSIPDAFYASIWAPSVALWDVNNDQCADLFGASDANHISIRLNQGDGTFAAPVIKSVQEQPQTIVAGDIDADADIDLVVPNRDSSSFSRLRNQGTGTFTNQVVFSTASNPWDLSLADVDSDGDLDAVVGVSFPNMVIAVSINNGTGGFGTPVLSSVNERFDRIATGDFNADLMPDVAYSSVEEHHVGVLLNQGNGAFGTATVYSPGARPGEIAAGDIDNDGDLDLVTTSGLNDAVIILLNDGAADFSSQIQVNLASFGGNETRAVVLADWENDGDIDFVATNRDSDSVVVGLNDGDGDFFVFTTLESLPIPIGASAGDVDGDGYSDLAIGLDSDSTVAIIRNQCAPGESAAPLTDFTVTFGSLISGVLQDLVDSDNAWVRGRSRFGFLATEPNVVDLQVGAVTTVQNPSSLDLTVEGRINQSGGTSKLRLRNWSSNGFEQVHQYPIGTTETVEGIEDVNAANRVRQSDGRIELSIRQSVVTTFTVMGFDSYTDQVLISVQ